MKYLLIFLMIFSFPKLGIGNTSTVQLEITDGYSSIDLKRKIEKNLGLVLTRINEGQKLNLKSLNLDDIKITENAKGYLEAIWESGTFYCTKELIQEKLLKTNDGFEIRNIPILIDDKYQQLVFTMNSNATITDIYFSVLEHQYKNITIGNKVLDETKKNIIRDFLESFKTSYIKKDINFINNVFSDKALIVVGKSIKLSDRNGLKVVESNKSTIYDSGNNSSYKKMTKEEYINGLKNVFKNNKKISVEFEDIEIMQHRKSGYDEFYGVRLKQRWRSDNYSDYGILFFVIQFRKNDYPLIWVRVWQDANTTPESEQIGLGDILIQPK